jgi:nitrite reductase (NADH) small subunit|tara:strand:- start:3691 stop:4035 length:345 start_codon:yes stop_codon:yes gene_type:complete
MMNATSHGRFEVCAVDDLCHDAGVAIKIADQQIALFYLPEESRCLYAIDNFDPIGEANVLSRGIVGDKSGELVVASPLYKQHFSLESGRCSEDESVMVRVYPVAIENGAVFIWI